MNKVCVGDYIKNEIKNVASFAFLCIVCCFFTKVICWQRVKERVRSSEPLHSSWHCFPCRCFQPIDIFTFPLSFFLRTCSHSFQFEGNGVN